LAFGCLIEAEMEFIVMSTKDFDASSRNADSSASKPAPKPHAAPSMLWLLLPVALLALLTFLSR
jgi:hypothetical protein